MIPSTLRDDPRISSIDASRGLALFGVLVVNICVFSSPYYGYGAGVEDANFHRVWDKAARFFVAMVFETKFYLLFSFLIGYSFTLQMAAADQAKEAFLPRFLRRQGALLIIGLTHAVLLFHGDILSTYAILGVVLLFLRGWSDRTALVAAIGLVASTAMFWAGLALWQPSLLDIDGPVLIRHAARVQSNYLDAPGSVIRQHIAELPSVAEVILLIQGPCALAMFLVGLVCGRRQVFSNFEVHRTRCARLLRFGAAVGLPGSVFYAVTTISLESPAWQAMGLAVDIATAPFLAAAYLSLAMLAFHGLAGKTLAKRLAPAGRMALSNYLMQSLLCAAIFHAYGLRLMGSVAPWLSIALAVTIFAAQVALSGWWMSRHAYGPVEWLLRLVTLMRVPAWQR